MMAAAAAAALGVFPRTHGCQIHKWDWGPSRNMLFLLGPELAHLYLKESINSIDTGPDHSESFS